MSTSTPKPFNRTAEQTHHCREDALSDREFERLVEATHEMDEYRGLEARFIVFAAARLGMRAGEIVHATADWVDWRREMVQIPRHESCDRGRDGGLCGSCRQAARQMVQYHDDLSLAAAEDLMWSPKTESSAREIPLTTTRATIALEDYFERFDEFQISQTGVNRRVERAAELADGLDPADVYPHALRATCASFFAARGLNAVALKSLMGWSDFSVALKYIEDSGERTSQALDSIVN